MDFVSGGKSMDHTFFSVRIIPKIIPKWYEKITIFGIRKLKIWYKKTNF